MKLPKSPKLPSLSKLKPTPKASAKARPRIKPPAAVEDIYRDMRDRRLLLPALALVIAIIAVPVALSASPEEPPAPVAFVAPEGSEAVAPAVLTEAPMGVRDYRDRLDALKSKNPFKQHFVLTPDELEQASELTEPAAAPRSAADSQPVAPEPSFTPDPSAVKPEPQPIPSSPSEPPEPVILAPRIDVFAGLKGEGRVMRDVEAGDLVPSKKTAPVVMFLGTNNALTEAKFVVSNDVTETDGDGRCRPNRRNCEFLSMETGEKRSFTYGPHDREYVVRIVDIYEKALDRKTQTK